jgi:hypothetical protein
MSKLLLVKSIPNSYLQYLEHPLKDSNPEFIPPLLFYLEATLEIAVENGEAIPSCLGFYIVEQSPPYLV